MLKILCIGTEWFSKNGGLSTFNRLLCETLAKFNSIKVFCYLPEFSDDEYNNAKTKGVELIRPKRIPGMDFNALMNNRPILPESVEIDIVIGHDRITGPSMQALCNNFYQDAKKIFFIHTAPGEIEWLKPEQLHDNPAGKAEEREIIQKELAKESTLIVAVGPKLYNEISATMAGLPVKPKIIRFDPGLYQAIDSINFHFDPSPISEALIMGRLEDFHLKGVDIAFESMAQVYTEWDIKINNILLRPKIIIRGAAVGSEKQLLAKLNQLIPTTKLIVNIRNYSPDIEVINEEIRRSALLLMPSRAEGFGLVAVEALSLGRPVLISENTGLAMLISEIAPAEAPHWIIPDDGAKGVIGSWARSIRYILSDRNAAAVRLQRLVGIYAASTSWDKSVNFLLEQITGHSITDKSYIVDDIAILQPNHQNGAEKLTTDKEALGDEINKIIGMELGTKLVQKYMGLSIIRKFAIAKELDILEEGESMQSANLDKLCSLFLQRAFEKKKLRELWDKVFDKAKEPNPF